MLVLDGLYRRAPSVMARLAPWTARLMPLAALAQYARLSGLPLEARYRGVCRGVTAPLKPQLLGFDGHARSDQLLDDIFAGYFQAAQKASPLNRMLYVDTKVWLPDDLLIKADKMTMATGLELRVPFLDHKLVEFAATLPDGLKLGRQGGKALLRQAMRHVLPPAILGRSKKGFPTPIASWLRSPLRVFAREALLDPDSGCSQYLDRRALRQIVEDNEQGRVDRCQEVWTLLIFEFWHRLFIDRRLQPAVSGRSRMDAVAA